MSFTVGSMPAVRMVAAAGWRYHRHGRPNEVLQYEKFRIPFDRKSTDVVVKMVAAPVQPHDKTMIQGYYPLKPLQLPAVGGVEGLGVVEEVGSACTLKFNEGDFVWVNNQRVGTWATHIVTDGDNLDVVPNRAELEPEYLASLSTYHTAWNLVHEFENIQPGDVVLQTGAAGSVAQLCGSMVRARGGKLFQAIRMGRTEHDGLVSILKKKGAFAVVPYHYTKMNYMRRLLSDIPPPKLLLNQSGGQYANSLVKLLGDGGTCVTYGCMSSKPFQVANLDLINRGLKFVGYFHPDWIATHSREARMRLHQNVIERMTLVVGFSGMRCMRFKMHPDATYAFAQTWSPCGHASRKSILRMIGEYGEWRRPQFLEEHIALGIAIWDDITHMSIEFSAFTDNPQSMKYYTPYGNLFTDFFDAKQAREAGHRELFYKRPHSPRHNSDEPPPQKPTSEEEKEHKVDV